MRGIHGGQDFDDVRALTSSHVLCNVNHGVHGYLRIVLYQTAIYKAKMNRVNAEIH